MLLHRSFNVASNPFEQCQYAFERTPEQYVVAHSEQKLKVVQNIFRDDHALHQHGVFVLQPVDCLVENGKYLCQQLTDFICEPALFNFA